MPLPLVLGLNRLTYIQVSSPPALYRQTQLGGEISDNEITFDPGTAVLTTDAIALTPGPGKVMRLTVEATDTSLTTGFDADDTVKVELLSTLPGGTQIIETLSHDADLNTNGLINGGATPLADEFNLEQKPNAGKWTSTFRFLGEIPAEATSVQLRITAAILGQPTPPITEIFRFKNAYLLTGDGDADGDGIGENLEGYIHGTRGDLAASRFGLASITSAPGTITLRVNTGNFEPRTYQLLTSPDLLTWTRDGPPTLVPGNFNGPWPPLPLTRPTTPQRSFYKVQVQQPQVDIP